MIHEHYFICDQPIIHYTLTDTCQSLQQPRLFLKNRTFIMDDIASFRVLLTQANFGARARAAITDFCCETLTELAHLPEKELNTSISNLHKALANHGAANQRVRLNATKITLLYAISSHFLD